MANLDLLTRMINTLGEKLQDAQYRQKDIWPALSQYEDTMVPIRVFVLQARDEMRDKIYLGVING